MITILSDIHLGHSASLVKRPEQIYPLLCINPEIIFNGDTFEHRFEKEEESFSNYKSAFNSLLTERGDIRYQFLTGNHDPNISDYHYIYINNCIVTHGDVINPSLLIQPNNPTLDPVTDYRVKICNNTKSLPSFTRNEKVNYFVRNTLQPTKLLSTLSLWKNFHTNLYSNFEEDRIETPRVFITGHIHRPSIHKSKDFISVNTGSFMPLLGRYLVELDHKYIYVRKIDYINKIFYPGKLIEKYPIL